MTGIDTSGVPQFAQPSASNISGLGSLATLSAVNNSNWSGAALSIANGGTGQGTASTAFNALSPLTTAGDIVIGGAGGAAQRSGSALGGVSLLALGAGARSIAAQNQVLLKQASALPTPTIYYDPTATGGTGTGASAANACYTVAQLQSATSGDMSGQVIGFAYGTTTTSEIALVLGASSTDKPVIVCPYSNGNGSTALPMIDCGTVLSAGWSVYSGSIYQNTIGGTVAKQMWQAMPDGTQRRIQWIYGTTLSAMASQLATAGPGYGFLYSGTLYVIPYNNVDPSTGVIVVPSSATPSMGSGGGGLVITYRNQAASANIVVYGIAVRHTFGSAIYCSIGTTNSSITSLGPVSVVGCDVQHCGRPIDVMTAFGGTVMPNGGGDDGIIVYGKNNTVRTSVRVANNYTNDVGNNACELGFVSSGYVEFNTAVDSGSHGLVENYASVSNVVCRYNFATWVNNSTHPWYNGSTANYMGRITWQAAFDQTNYAAGTGQTATTAAQSVNNSWIGNVALNCPASCGGSGTAILDDGCSGLVFKNNTFVISSPGNSLTQPLIFGNSLSASWNTPPVTPVAWNNNIFISDQIYTNCRMMYVSPNCNTGYAPTGDNNIWFSNAANWYNYFDANGTNYNAASGRRH